MATWGEILNELQATASDKGNLAFDEIRKKYLDQVHGVTRRPVFFYYTDWLSGKDYDDLGITLRDMQGMMEVCRGVAGPSLDILLHSPGGSAEATASIVRYLRQKFTDIRVIVPLAAMSAATMWALSANTILMGKHSQLGPIDPQVPVAGRFVPAKTLVDQFERAKAEIAGNTAFLGAWAPIIQQYPPGLLEICEDALELSTDLVTDWLTAYMFAGEDDPRKMAETAAAFFANYNIHKSHSLGIPRDAARAVGVKVTDLEANPREQDAFLSLHHVLMLSAHMSIAQKLIGNSLGVIYITAKQPIAIGGTAAPPVATPVPPPTSPPVAHYR